MDALIDTHPHIQSLILYDWSGETGLRKAARRLHRFHICKTKQRTMYFYVISKNGEDSGNYKLLDFGVWPTSNQPFIVLSCLV
jgi:hypothetical protein